MFFILLSYTLKPFMLKVLYLVLLIPVILAVLAYFIMKRCKRKTARYFEEQDRKMAKRMAEIAAEKALDDDFGTEWHIHGSDS